MGPAQLIRARPSSLNESLADSWRHQGGYHIGGGAAAAAVDVYRPDQDAEEEVLLEDSTDSDEFDDM